MPSMAPDILSTDHSLVHDSIYGERLDPFFLAEQIPLQKIIDTPLRKDSLAQTWRTIEAALSDEHTPHNRLDPRIEQCYLNLQDTALHDPSLQRRLQAKMFVANFGMLALRAHREAITAEDIEQSYGILTQAIGDELPRSKNDRRGRGILAEMVTYGLIARAADPMNAPFVGSSREESSPWPLLNHDIYTLDEDRTLKTAVQVRLVAQAAKQGEVSKNAPPGSFVLVHFSENFFEAYAPKLEAMQPRTAKEQKQLLTLRVAGMLAHEAKKSYDPNSPEDFALTSLSKHLINKLNAHRRRILGLEPWPQSTTSRGSNGTRAVLPARSDR
ncbi:MAG: hypothetical protein ACQR33_02160 [Candidatus Saccharibacteria bacterium]